MNIMTACPDLAGLREYLLGRMSEAPAAAVEAHLAACTACRKLLPTVQAEDDLVADFRAQAGTPEPVSVLLDSLAVDLRGRLLPPDATTPADVDSMSAATLPPLDFAREEGLSLAPPLQPDEIGRLGGYRILKELGRGGMGVVYLAEDVRLRRRVALKAMLPGLAANPNSGRRFLREAQAMAAVEHDHIVRIYQVDEDCGVPFLAMEFLKGEPLDARLKCDEQLPLAEVLRIGREIAEGLAAAHAQGLIHRDIKPGNVWLEAPHGRVKILDFGLARAATQDAALTQQGAIVGTPAYMAPEQARGETVDARCDLFSLGVVLYRLTTGRQPFRGSDSIATLMAVALDAPASPLQINPELSQELSDMVMKMLEKNPDRRPASADDVARALHALERRVARLEGQERTEALTAAPRPSARRRIGVLVGLLMGGAAVVAAAAIIVVIRDKDGDKIAEVNVPPGGEVEVVDDGKKGEAAVALKPPMDDAWVKQVAALPADKQVEAVAAELKKRNPGFDGKVTPTIEGGVVVGLEFRAFKVTDLSPLRALTGLQSLSCGGWGEIAPVSDLSPLKDLKLVSMVCPYSQVSDLSPLRGMKLTHLDCGYTPVFDLSPLKGMPLQELSFGHTRVSDLSPLKGMPLTLLGCNNTPVSDLSPLTGMTLKDLWASGTPVSDLSPLKGMPLIHLWCDFMPGRDADILRSIKTLQIINDKPAAEFWKDVGAAAKPPVDDAFMAKVAALSADKQVEAVVAELKELNPGYDGKETHLIDGQLWQTCNGPNWTPGYDGKETHLIDGGAVTELGFLTDNVTDVSPVRALTELRKLSCKGTARGKGKLADLSPLSGLRLTSLNFGSNKVSDLSPLSTMKLKYLDCFTTRVSDLSPLKDMRLTMLSCSDTLVSDLSPLKGMKLTRLHCDHARVTDLSPLKGMPLQGLNCDFRPDRDAEILRSIPTLEKINDKPAAEFWKDVDAKKP